MATVKEIKGRIEELNNIYENMLKIQNTILHNENGTEMAKNVEELCELNNMLRNLSTLTARYISDEVKRLESLIDSAIIKIN